MMLSPSTVTFSAIGLRPGKVMVQPDVFAVAVSTNVVALVSPVVGTERMFHLPATSARLIGAGAGAAVVVEDDAIALVVSTAAFSFLAHPARTAAQRHNAMLVERCSVCMEPPVQVTDGYRPA